MASAVRHIFEPQALAAVRNERTAASVCGSKSGCPLDGWLALLHLEDCLDERTAASACGSKSGWPLDGWLVLLNLEDCLDFNCSSRRKCSKAQSAARMIAIARLSKDLVQQV